MARFAEIEHKVDRIEAQVESYEVTAAKSLQQEFEALEGDSNIEAELAELKKQVDKKAA